MPEPINIPLRSLGGIIWGHTRRREPITIGIPFPRAALTRAADLVLDGPSGRVPIQVRSLDSWPDGSIRWALIDTVIDVEADRLGDHVLRTTPGPSSLEDSDLVVVTVSNGVDVSTSRATFGFRVGGRFPFSSVSVGGAPILDAETSGFVVEADGGPFRGTISEVHVRETGPLRAELEVRGTLGSAPQLDVWARVEIFAGTATSRLNLTLRNPRRAQHPSGRWPLGDPGSVLLRSSKLVLVLGRPADRIRAAVEPAAALAGSALPFEIHQESSGGMHWNGAVHKNGAAAVPLRFRGYRLQEGGQEVFANRASPIVDIDAAMARLTVAVPRFWENFPQSVRVSESTVEVAFFPVTADLHELQGGEQKTHTVVLAFAGDTVSNPPLAWVHDPLSIYASPEWCCRTGAVPFLIPASEDPHAGYLTLVNGALDPAAGFVAKRERADEYGWRNFGDLPADHESSRQPPDHPLVSHYNNQYDAVAGFAIHFLRTGDRRWWQLCQDLARHVQDIDIYHTRDDKAAYNGGLFWHTNHYTDAGTSTHRTYPREGSESGGPSAEHNYNAGLMLHYFMTGDKDSRDRAIGLGRWVVDMDNGGLTPFRWLAKGATGLASATGSMTYHGPGRGAANSVVACLVAHQLSGEAGYLAKAEELITRCVHPDQDIEALQLKDVERRWYYTVFLQALGAYLSVKQERQEMDAAFWYARASLLHYARWMVIHERPYLSRPEILEFPTETWAAQDMRKADVFQSAAIHASGPERDAFLERAAFFFTYSIDALAGMPGRVFTRPTVLMLSNGVRYGWLTTRSGDLGTPVSVPRPNDVPPPQTFEPQKVRAIRRATWLAAATTVVIAAIVAWAAFAEGR